MNLVIPAESIIEQDIYFPLIDQRLDDWKAEKSLMQNKKNTRQYDKYISEQKELTKKWRDEFHGIANDKIVGYKPLNKPAAAYAFYHLTDILGFLVFNFLLEYRSKIIKKNISRIYLTASDSFITNFEMRYEERFDYLVLLVNHQLNKVKKMVMPVDQDVSIFTEVHHMHYKEMMKQIRDLAYEDSEYEEKSEKYNLFHYREITPEITGDEGAAIAKWNIEFLGLQELKDKSKSTFANGTIYYFLGHLNLEMVQFLSPFDRAVGLEYINENEMDRDFLEICLELGAMPSYLSQLGQSKRAYYVPFIQALGPGLKSKIENLLKENYDYRFLCLINPDSVITRKITSFIITQLGNEVNYNVGFKSLDEFNADDPDMLSARYLIIEGFEQWEIRLQRMVWNRLETGALKNGFVLFISKDTPIDHHISPAFDNDHVWKYDAQIIEKNTSLIFHSLISEKYDIPLSEMLYKAIEHNMFHNLISFPKMSLWILQKTLNSLGENPKFNYHSADSWYKYRKEYEKNMQPEEDKNKQEKNGDSAELELRFIYNEKSNQWKISGYIESDKSYKNSKTLLYATVIVLHTKKFNKGIDKDTLIKLVEELDKKYNGKGDRINSNSEKSDPIYAALKTDKAINKYPRRLQKIFRENFKIKSGEYFFNPEVKVSEEKYIKLNCSILFFEEADVIFKDLSY